LAFAAIGMMIAAASIPRTTHTQTGWLRMPMAFVALNAG
jgi:hypothetical protein